MIAAMKNAVKTPNKGKLETSGCEDCVGEGVEDVDSGEGVKIGVVSLVVAYIKFDSLSSLGG